MRFEIERVKELWERKGEISVGCIWGIDVLIN
jgi:hypothetical protein